MAELTSTVRVSGPNRKFGLLMGFYCALAALVIAALYGLLTGNLGDPGLMLAAPTSAFLTGALIWWCMHPAASSMSKPRGAVAGGLTGAVAHFPFWVFLVLASSICPEHGDSCGWPVDGGIDLLEGLPAALFLSLASLVVVGWLTVPVGATIGALSAESQNHR